MAAGKLLPLRPVHFDLDSHDAYATTGDDPTDTMRMRQGDGVGDGADPARR